MWFGPQKNQQVKEEDSRRRHINLVGRGKGDWKKRKKKTKHRAGRSDGKASTKLLPGLVFCAGVVTQKEIVTRGGAKKKAGLSDFVLSRQKDKRKEKGGAIQTGDRL